MTVRCLGSGLLAIAWSGLLLAADAKPVYDSQLVSPATPGHAVKVEADITGAKELFLVVRDGGDSFGCDWADWADAKLVGPTGELKLTDLKWKLATSGHNQVRINANVEGRPMRINGQEIANGIGTHANSVIAFDLPAGFTKFVATAGLDDGGTQQGCGSTVQFLVFTQKPPAALLNSGSAPGGGSRDLGAAVTQLDVAPGLEVQLFAGEPNLFSPSNIDVDHLGRVWVMEVVNYRRFANPTNPDRPAGDRILVLEDTDGNSVCDKTTVFYQGRDLDGGHGVCVLGDRVIVSAGDSVFSLYDRDGDLKADADSKELLFTGISGAQHDHGIHAFVFGPDGKLYFNFGNAGQQLKDKHGQPIVDMAGNEINDKRKPYQEGMVFRCDLDGSHVETLGWNFRNNWEVCVDSFGTLWQSDNDDDGNRGVRINYVMEYGNYGYKDEFTGAGWQSPRTNLEAEIPLQHWHLNDPGVVPNLLQTGAGSPTGICVYEGDLLPEVFRNQIIHCDAGPNVVRCYPVQPEGAGYKAEIVNVLEGARDKWFRPSDVCVAPDGSLIIADWYDPGVGGHRQGDVERGRIFRVAPPGAKYTVPKADFSTVEGALAALKSPNLATRYLAWQALSSFGEKAEAALATMFREDPNPRLRARALWLLGTRMYWKKGEFLENAVADASIEVRLTAMRLARQIEGLRRKPRQAIRRIAGWESVNQLAANSIAKSLQEAGLSKKFGVLNVDLEYDFGAATVSGTAENLAARDALEGMVLKHAAVHTLLSKVAVDGEKESTSPREFYSPTSLKGIVERLAVDDSPAVRRECLIALRELNWEKAPAMWAELASRHTGNDRWELESLGIGAGQHWDEYLAEYLKRVPNALSTKAGRDIVWRSRATQTPELLARIITDPQTPAAELPRYFRALDFQQGESKNVALAKLAFESSTLPEDRRDLIVAEAIERLQGFDISQKPEQLAALNRVLEQKRGTSQFLTLVDRFGLADRYPEVVPLLELQPDSSLAIAAVKLLVAKGQSALLQAGLRQADALKASAVARALGNAADNQTAGLLLAVVDDPALPLSVRQEAVKGLGRSRQGVTDLLQRVKAKQLDEDLVPAAAFALQNSAFEQFRNDIVTLFPLPPSRNEQPLPPLAQLLKTKGDIAKGKAVFSTVGKCNTCHVVAGEGKEVGPNLTEIGSKLSREAMFESILYPSAGISHNYETWTAATDSGNVVTGIKVSETDGEIVLKGSDGLARTLKKSELEELKKQPVSLMPADLQKTMTVEELIDVIEYVQTLKKK